MKRLVLPAVIVPLLMAPGCPEQKFEVVMQMTPEGKVQRELTVWTSEDNNTNPPSEDVRAAAEAAYGGAGREVGARLHFVGEFDQRLPADLIHQGGKSYGFMSVAKSQMGSVSSYVERMPGEADLRGLFRRGNEIADTLARIMEAGLSERLKAKVEPERIAQLSAFLKTEFRDDVFNALLIGWQAVVRGSTIEDLHGKAAEGMPEGDQWRETFWTTEIARFVAFAVEHGYVEPRFTLDEDAWADGLLRGFIRKAAVAMGYAADDSLPAELASLAERETLAAVYQSGLKSIGMSDDEFNALLDPAMPDLFGGGTNGDVVWRCKTEPTMTNGDYNAEYGTVRWSAAGRKGCAPPQMLLAVWAEPNEEFQREHFGHGVLLGEALSEYVSWREELDAGQKGQWDEFVAGLTPGNDLQARLQNFRFRSAVAVEPASKPAEVTDEPKSQPVQGATLLLRWLGLEGE